MGPLQGTDHMFFKNVQRPPPKKNNSSKQTKNPASE